MNSVICADSNEYLKTFPNNYFDLIIADPPYFGVVDAEWDQWDDLETYLDWCKVWIKESQRILKESGNFYIWGGVGEKSDSIIHIKLLTDNYLYFKDWITWKKQRGMGMRKGWLYTREEILWYVKNNKKFIWNRDYQYSDEKRTFTATYKDPERMKKYKESVKSDYKRITNVWDDIRETNISWNKKEIKTKHPTPKPEKAIQRMILPHISKDSLVLDLFSGTGTTSKVCKVLNIRSIAVEYNENLCKLITRRLLD